MLTDTSPSVVLVVPREGNEQTSFEFDKSVAKTISDHPESIAVDCSQLEQVTSSHVAMLWQAYQSCTSAKIQMFLLSPPPHLMKILKLLDLDDLFNYIADPDAEQYSDEFTTDAFSINIAMRQFTEFLVRLGVPKPIEFELKTIFYEVATNIRSHSGLHPEDKIRFTVRPAKGRVTMAFVDDGAPFDPTECVRTFEPEQAARLGQKNGFGIAMINKLADKLSYTRRPEGKNVLTIEKKWSR